MAEQYFNPIKKRLREKDKVLAAWIQMCSPIATEVLAQTGFDVFLFDLEHSPADPMTLVSLLHAIKGTGVIPFARAPWNDMVAIKKILDTGVMGIHIPYVSTYEEALSAVAACKYQTQGVRGIAKSPRAVGYGLNIGSYLERANDEIVTMIALETPTAIENLEKILTIPDLDGIFIGPMDLATSMGCFANQEAKAVQEAIEQIEKRVLPSEKFLGTVASNWKNTQELFDKGYSYIVAASDWGCLRKGAMEITTPYKQYCKKA